VRYVSKRFVADENERERIKGRDRDG